MAFYVRTVTAGGASYDPRSWTYAVYKCDCCGEESEYTLTPNFQTVPRLCKHCKSMGVEDKINSLKAERNDLLKKIADLNSKLLNLDTELSEIESKKNVGEQIEQITK